MKRFTKNGYLFLILFILIISKNYILSFFTSFPQSDIKDEYVLRLENEIEEINLFKNNDYKSTFYYGKAIYQNPYKNGYIDIVTSSDKVKEGDLVISDSVLLGTINKVRNKSAEVKTIYADDYNLQVNVNNCYGILKGNKIYAIDNYCPLAVGDEVYTSSLGKIKDKILIGTISKMIKDKNGISNTFILKPMKNFSNINYLIIIGGE